MSYDTKVHNDNIQSSDETTLEGTRNEYLWGAAGTEVTSLATSLYVPSAYFWANVIEGMFSLSNPLLQAKEDVISRSSSIAPEYTYYHPMVTSSPVFHIVPSIGIVTSWFIMNKELVVIGLDHAVYLSIFELLLHMQLPQWTGWKHLDAFPIMTRVAKRGLYHSWSHFIIPCVCSEVGQEDTYCQ